MAQRVKDKTLFGWLRNIFKKGDGGVHNDHHESLSDENKIVEDYLEVGKFVANRMKLTNIVGLQCDLSNDGFDPLKAIMQDDSLVELDFYKYVHHNDADMSERLMEIDSLLSDCDKQYIQDKVIEESRKLFSNK